MSFYEKVVKVKADVAAIWPNSTLASTAVGLFMELVTPWHAGSLEHSVIYDYDGNGHTTTLSPRIGALANTVLRTSRPPGRSGRSILEARPRSCSVQDASDDKAVSSD